MDLAKLSYLRFSMPHCQHVFAHENVPKDAYNDMNASSAWINKLFTDNPRLHLTVPYRSANKYADTNFSWVFWVCKINQKSGRFWQDHCYSMYDNIPETAYRYLVIYCTVRNTLFRHVNNEIASVCMIVSLGQLTDTFFTWRFEIFLLDGSKSLLQSV